MVGVTTGTRTLPHTTAATSFRQRFECGAVTFYRFMQQTERIPCLYSLSL